jgi:serine/threonine protein kinase
MVPPQEQREFIEESEVLANLEHPSVVIFHGIAVLGSSLLLVQELCARSMRQLLDDAAQQLASAAAQAGGGTARGGGGEVAGGGGTTEGAGAASTAASSKPHVVAAGCSASDLPRLLLEIASGMAYVHSQGVIHRDLKPENVLLTSKNAVKIADFGLARFDPVADSTMTHCGTPYYVSTRASIAGMCFVPRC